MWFLVNPNVPFSNLKPLTILVTFEFLTEAGLLYQPVAIERICLFSQPFPCVKLSSHRLQHRPCPLAKEKLLSFFSSQHISEVNRFSSSAIYNYLKIRHYSYSLPMHQNHLVGGICPTFIYSYREATGRMNFYPGRRKHELFQHLSPCDF